jgi:methionine-rich copper-binding protein CopC
MAPRVARAHAVVIESVPAVDSVVPAGDLGITLRYNSRIDHERSRLTLTAADGKVATLPIRTDSAPDILVGRATGLAPGHYRLRWQVLAVDGHLTRGDIPFTVQAP